MTRPNDMNEPPADGTTGGPDSNVVGLGNSKLDTSSLSQENTSTVVTDNPLGPQPEALGDTRG